MDNDYAMVEDFDAHVPFMEPFHRRYIPSSRALKMWAAMARNLEIDIIAPQHGAQFVGKELCGRFIDWIDGLETGLDLMGETFVIPA